MEAEEFVPRQNWINDRQYFYKYVSRSTAELILKNQTLRWSTPSLLNDPYDIQFNLNLEINYIKVKKDALDKLWKVFYEADTYTPGNIFGELVSLCRDEFPKMSRDDFEKEFGESIDQSFRNMQISLPKFQNELKQEMASSKILCLTESVDNELMWAHYSEAHKGAVIRLKSIPELDSPWGMARQVKYKTKMPRLYDDEFFSDFLSGQITFDAKQILDWLVYTKSQNWAYEKEWRIYAGSGRAVESSYEDIRFDKTELDAVIFGQRMLSEDRIELAAITQQLYPHAEILNATLSESDYEIGIVRFDF